MSADVNRTFAESAGRLRVQRGWSQDRLAKEAGISQSMLSLIELAKCSPNLTMALKIAGALDVPLGVMLGEAAYARGEFDPKISRGSDA